MDRRIFGVIFLAIGAALYASRFVCAAIYGSGMASQSHELFEHIYDYVGFGLSGLALAFFALGGAYLLWGELESADKKVQFSQKMKDFWESEASLEQLSAPDEIDNKTTR